MSTVKYYIKDNNSNYFVIYKNDIERFISENKNARFLTNDKTLFSKNITLSEFSNEKWSNLINYKAKNNIFAQEITPLYIEEASITQRKN